MRSDPIAELVSLAIATMRVRRPHPRLFSVATAGRPRRTFERGPDDVRRLTTVASANAPAWFPSQVGVV